MEKVKETMGSNSGKGNDVGNKTRWELFDGETHTQKKKKRYRKRSKNRIT